jgi:hypothetical protein
LAHGPVGGVGRRWAALVVSTNELHLARVSRNALPSMLFIPAEIDGRKVREPVQMPFSFKIQP